jgi:hypothetical protein
MDDRRGSAWRHSPPSAPGVDLFDRHRFDPDVNIRGFPSHGEEVGCCRACPLDNPGQKFDRKIGLYAGGSTTELPRSHDMCAPRWWLMAAAGMAGTMGAVADNSLQITAKTARRWPRGHCWKRLSEEPGRRLRVGEVGNQHGSFAADLLQEQPHCLTLLNQTLCLGVLALALPCLARCSRSGFAACHPGRGERPWRRRRAVPKSFLGCKDQSIGSPVCLGRA